MIVIIPARLNSSRLPKKLLADIAGKTVLQRTAETVKRSLASRIIIATDHQDIAKHATAFCSEIIMTSNNHPSGTDRLAEVVKKLNISDEEVIINVQGDEPFIPAEYINKCARELIDSDSSVSTLAYNVNPLDESLKQSSSVKVICDKDNRAMYFSRATIPFNRNGDVSANYLHHIGIYAYRAGFLRNYSELEACDLEKVEKLEQLRVLWNGYAIQVGIVPTMPVKGIDTVDDLIRANHYINSKNKA